MRILRAIAYAGGLLCATGVSANEAFEFSFHDGAEKTSEHTAFIGAQGARFQHRLGRRVTIEINFSANSQQSKAQQNLARAIKPRGVGQPLKIGRATVSLGATMGVRFGLKF